MALTDILKKIQQLAASSVKTLEAEYAQKEKQWEAEYTEKASAKEAMIAENAKQAEASLIKKIESIETKETNGIMQKAYANIVSGQLSAFVTYLSDPQNAEKTLKTLLGKLSDKPGKLKANKAFVSLLKKHAPATLEILEDESVSAGFVVAYKDHIIDNQFENLVHSELKDELSDVVVRTFNLSAV